ncbi:hypothetical protein BC937DRAFT_90973 [Endogone sp. FLAS-F59071]|nr:hypothetical protein BC937DRAFT_90973 [Endogone sp. FLAS-F59071]|eukprot:RUS16638.1 hypothetical protein BC937DRAFT_90973 [Endogone sp. FLAS-F59071]
MSTTTTTATTATTTTAPPSAAQNHTVDIPLTSRPSTPIKPRQASTTALAASSSSTSLRIHTLADQSQPAPSIYSPKSPESPEDAFYSSSDPLLLNARKMSETDIKDLRKTQGRKVQNFYREQNELIDVLLGPLNPIDQEEEEEKRLFKLKIAIYGSLIANIILFSLQLVAAISTGSLSLFATMADSFMDLLSSVILTAAGRAASKENVEKYPTHFLFLSLSSSAWNFSFPFKISGQVAHGDCWHYRICGADGHGFNPTNCTYFPRFSFGIKCVYFESGKFPQEIVRHRDIEAIRTLIGGDHSVDVDIKSIVFVSIALGTKFFLYLYCSALAQYSTAKVLAQDHRNDLFVNGLGLTTALLGGKISWWIDPIGAIVVALIIFQSWSFTAYADSALLTPSPLPNLEQIQLIVGKSADPAFLQRVTYIALTHHPKVLQVDTARAYHAGQNFFVEVDIVLPADMPLRESHDIGEALQMKLESLPSVERAFVHADYETSHRPEVGESGSASLWTSEEEPVIGYVASLGDYNTRQRWLHDVIDPIVLGQANTLEQ